MLQAYLPVRYSSEHKSYVIAVKLLCYGNILQCDDIVFLELTINRLTVGKIYAGLLIAENWKAYRASKVMLKRNRGNENESALAKANSVSLDKCGTKYFKNFSYPFMM